MEYPETAKPSPRPWPLPGISCWPPALLQPSPTSTPSCDMVTTTQFPARVRTARSAPPYLGAPRGPAARRAGGGAPGRLRPSFLAFSFAFGVGGARWLRPGSASALAPPTQEGARGLHPAAERADLGQGRRRGLCSRSHVPTLRGVRVFTSLVGVGRIGRPQRISHPLVRASTHSSRSPSSSPSPLTRGSGVNGGPGPLSLSESLSQPGPLSEPQFTPL